jgi:hypothetical protein
VVGADDPDPFGIVASPARVGKQTRRCCFSCDAAAGRLQDKAHVHTEVRQHVDQPIRAEQIDAAAQQIADTRLSDMQQLTAWTWVSSRAASVFWS